MPARRLVVIAAGPATLLAASLLVACSPGTAGFPAISPTASAISSPTQQPAMSAEPSATDQPTPAGTTISRCATGWLQMSLGITQGATGNERTVVTMVNRSGSTCYLGGYPGVEMVDSSGHNLGDAQWSTDSFFGTYAASHRVEISVAARPSLR